MRTKFRLLVDSMAEKSMLLLTAFFCLIALFIGIGLYTKSLPLLDNTSIWELLKNSEWLPSQGKFGFYPFIIGTLWVTGIAILIALPLCLFSAIYISEYAHPKLKNMIVPFVDLLSGIPPVVFGVWGVLFIVPLVGDVIAPHFVEFSTGYCILSGGIVLGVMIFPLIINVLLEVFATIPKELRDASLSLGATKWQTSKKVLLKKAFPGIIAATVLAISRAFGETIAVLMVCGNIPDVPPTMFDGGYPLPALIANNYGEMLSVPMYDAALMFAAFILFAIIFLFNAVSRFILYKLEKY